MKKLLAAVLLSGAAVVGHAQQTLPSMIRVIVPFAPGAGTDIMARAAVNQLATRLGVTMIVENKPGGSGVIGLNTVLSSPRDGSSLFFHSSSLVTAAATSRSFPPNSMDQLVPIGMVADSPLFLGVTAKHHLKAPADFVAWARSQTDGVTFSSAGVGSSGHLSAELLGVTGKFKVRHIPYRGAAPALVDVAAGAIDATIGTYSTLASQVVNGRVIIVGIGSAKPSPMYPDIKPLNASAPGYDVGHWYGLFAAKGTPSWILERLNKEIAEVGKTGQLAELVKSEGSSPQSLSLDEFNKRVRADFEMWKKIAADRQIVVE